MWRVLGVEGREEEQGFRGLQQFGMGGCDFSYKVPFMHLVAKLCFMENYVVNCAFCNLTTEQMRGETRFREKSTMLTNNIAHIKLCIFSESEFGSYKSKTSCREENGFSQAVI